MFKVIEIYVNKVPEVYGSEKTSLMFPEHRAMPLEAVKATHKAIDKFLNNDEPIFRVYSNLPEVVSFIIQYKDVRKFKTRLFFGDKKITTNNLFIKFNKVFHYIIKVTSPDQED